MKSLRISALTGLMLLLVSHARSQYWQQEVNYSIDVRLDDKEHTLDGFLKLDYKNQSPDTLHFIWFHLWPNAYKSDRSAFSEQALENGNTDFYFSGKDQRGYINRLDFKVNTITAQTQDHPQHLDIVKLILPEPLLPGKSITITTPFHVKLPFNFSRGGHDGETYQCTQWYPKPAVYDRKGWHPMPYLDQGEFYSEFGRFDVRITLPANYAVAATGELQDEAELNWLKARKDFSWTPIKEKVKIKGSTKTITQKFPLSSPALKTLHYIQNNVHDFAWFADKRFMVQTDTLHLSGGKTVMVSSFYTKEEEKTWKESTGFAKKAIQFYSQQLGEYPYKTATVVQGPKSFGGGMEYPTITVISPVRSESALDKLIAHELGHNWFYGILASHERKHPWMDEGMNSYYEEKYTAAHTKEYEGQNPSLLQTLVTEHKDQPIETASEAFSYLNYALIAYQKTSHWMEYLEKQLGTTAFQKAMQAYYAQWQFRHPYPEDFKQSLEQNTGRSLDSAFALLRTTGMLPHQQWKKGTQLVLGVPGDVLPRQGATKRNTILFSPFGLGINSYDKLMLGAFITNTMAPAAATPARLQFVAVPQYATGSKRLTGIGRISYRFFPQSGPFHKVSVFVNGASYSMNEFKNDNGSKTFLSFTKIVPGLRLTLREASARSQRERFFQWKTYLLREDQPRFLRDTIINGTDTSLQTRISKFSESLFINQFSFTAQNFRALYPWKAELKVDQGRDFIRPAFTANYFFNYPKEGGLHVRFFAGAFLYTAGKTTIKQFETDRYHLNMTGANGYEDYTYSDYFIGRNRFEKLASQQIMNRDGGFKVRTDLLADKVGKTDSWLMAVNFSSSIPSGLNPLSLLPVKIPLKVFADIGTYGDAWDRNSDLDRFVFDAGLHIPLLKETIHIYLPLVYSRVYKEYIQSTLEKKGQLWRTVSFTIDISNFHFKKIDRNIPF